MLTRALLGKRLPRGRCSLAEEEPCLTAPAAICTSQLWGRGGGSSSTLPPRGTRMGLVAEGRGRQ